MEISIDIERLASSPTMLDPDGRGGIMMWYQRLYASNGFEYRLNKYIGPDRSRYAHTHPSCFRSEILVGSITSREYWVDESGSVLHKDTTYIVGDTYEMLPEVFHQIIHAQPNSKTLMSATGKKGSLRFLNIRTGQVSEYGKALDKVSGTLANDHLPMVFFTGKLPPFKLLLLAVIEYTLQRIFTITCNTFVLIKHQVAGSCK